MAMGKAVVTTRTRGQADLVREGETGIYVPPRDPRALRAALEHLLTHPAEAEWMGRAGRMIAESELTLDRWVERVTQIVRAPPPAGATAHAESAEARASVHTTP
jgi:glycosyltransferase involved in cell wall biosynthesis